MDNPIPLPRHLGDPAPAPALPAPSTGEGLGQPFVLPHATARRQRRAQGAPEGGARRLPLRHPGTRALVDELFAALAAQNIPLVEAARRCGLDAGCLSRIKRGKRSPQVDTLMCLAEILGKTLRLSR